MKLYTRMVLFGCLCALKTSAQFNNAYDFKFKTYTSLDGLVHNYTKKCVEDTNGFLWIITQHGLSRFDGLNFKNFEHVYDDSTSLPENDLNDITVDNNNRIWISYTTGLCYYNQVDHSFHIIKENNKPVQNNAIVYDNKSNSIYSIDHNGYLKINCSDFSVTVYPFFHKLTTYYYNYWPILIDSKHRLWITLPRLGYFTIDLTTNHQYYYNEEIWPTNVFEDLNHQIWMTTWSNGLHNVIVTPTEHIHAIYSNKITDVNEPNPASRIQLAIAQSKEFGGDSILWILNETLGIQLFNFNKKKFVHSFSYNPQVKNGIATDFNNNIYSDKNGILWICTWHGLTKVNKQEQQFSNGEIPFLKSNFYNRLSGIIDDPNNKNIAWLTAEGSGLFKIDKATGKVLNRYFYDLENTKNSTVEDINELWRWTRSEYQDEEKNIWIPAGGLIKISNGKPSKISFQYKGEPVYNVVKNENHILWLATQHGVIGYDEMLHSFQIFKIDYAHDEANCFYDITAINNNLLAVAGKKGTFLFNTQTKKFTSLNWNFSYLDSNQQHVCYDLELINNNLFTATNQALICYNLQSNKAFIVGFKQGINFVGLHSLKKDSNNNLWICSSAGLYKYNLKDNSFQKFTTSDGIYDLSDDEIGFFEYNHLFYIGYRMAFTDFDPLEVNSNPVKSNPVITDVLINNKILPVAFDSFAKRSYHLSYKQNNIVINYTSVDFTNTDKVTFAYQLIGYDTSWQKVGAKRSTAFINLKSGNYQFKIKACNSSGLWNDAPAVFTFTIATPFWNTWWFYIIITIMFCGVLYKLYQYRINRLTALYKVRDNISKNLHDEIGATLSSINIYSDVAQQKLQGNDDVNKMLQRIHEGSAQAMESMSDIVWYVNPKNDNAENVIIKMREYSIPILEARQIKIDFVVDEKIKVIKLNMLQRQNIYLIFKEAINNIVKYAGANNVEAVLTYANNNIFLKLTDDGKGFDIQNHHQGNGLINMQQRAISLKGNFRIKSVRNVGTTIEINFPVSL